MYERITNTGNNNTGKRNTGNNNTGNNNSGDRNTGDWNTGNHNTGHWNTGDKNTGGGNTGNQNVGDENAGNENTGKWNTGHMNAGCRNTGDWNTGDWNSGDWNSGDWNSGNYNTGDWNTCNQSTGCFCTVQRPIMFFNKPTTWSLDDWRKSAARNLLAQIPKTVVEWISFKDMTDKEKAENPSCQTTGGYLRVLEEDNCSQIWWDNLSEKDRNIIKAIPNFDPVIFEQTTGIKISADEFSVLECYDDNVVSAEKQVSSLEKYVSNFLNQFTEKICEYLPSSWAELDEDTLDSAVRTALRTLL